MQKTINVFTIRNKENNEIIYAEGVLDCDSGADFKIESKWISENDKIDGDFILDYRRDIDCYSFSENVDLLCQKSFEKILFSVEEYTFDSLFSLKFTN